MLKAAWDVFEDSSDVWISELRERLAHIRHDTHSCWFHTVEHRDVQQSESKHDVNNEGSKHQLCKRFLKDTQ